jgi:hypothetical protein
LKNGIFLRHHDSRAQVFAELFSIRAGRLEFFSGTIGDIEGENGALKLANDVLTEEPK